MRRRLLVTFMAAGLVMASAGPAAAIDKPDWLPGNPLECLPALPKSKVPPVPQRPDNVGLINDPNLGSIRNDLAGKPETDLVADPFAPGSEASILDQYGYAGLEFHTYDLGCGGDAADPFAAMTTQFSNVVMLVPITALQALGFVADAAWPDDIQRPDWMQVFDEPFRALASAVSSGPFKVLFPLAAALLGLVMARKAKRQSTADAMSTAGWWAALTVMAVALMIAPIWAARQTDEVLGFGVGAVRSTFGAGVGPIADVGPVHRDVLYTAWLDGTFGSAESPAAQRWGAELFKAGAFSWQELRDIHDADQYRHAVETKQRRWMEVAANIEREFPDAYLNLQGKAGLTRPLAAVRAGVDAVAVVLLLLWAGILFIVARFRVRMVILIAPLAVILGVFPKHRHRIIALWNELVGSIVRAAVALFAAGLVSALIGAVRQAPNMSQASRILATILISYVAWKVTAPLRQLGMFGPGLKGAKSKYQQAKSKAMTLAQAKLGAGSVGLPPRKDPPATPHGSGSRTEYDVGHARTRTGDAAGTGYRPAQAGTPLQSGRSPIDAIPVTSGGRTVYRAKPRPTTPHRKVDNDASHADSRVRPTPAPAVYRDALPVRVASRPSAAGPEGEWR